MTAREAFESAFPDWAQKPGMASAWVGFEACWSRHVHHSVVVRVDATGVDREKLLVLLQSGGRVVTNAGPERIL